MGDRGEREATPLSGLASGFRDRTWVTAKLTAKAGLRALGATVLPSATRLGLGRNGDGARAAEALAEQLDGLKGLMMKAGQMASYLDPSLPTEARALLARLQAGARPMAFEVIDQVVREELGGPSHELFERFEERPFAAASIGQVHRAVHEGRPVAVKVQYPGIREAIAADLDTVGFLARIGSAGMALDTGEILAEVRERLLEECDYRVEARSQRLFGEAFGAWPLASVPAVVEERSAERVLTSELVDRLPFAEFVERSDQGARDRAGTLIFDAVYTTIHRRGVYNADPHPGNYLFTPEGEVTFLDFGCVRVFPPEMVASWKRMARSVLAGDRAAFREALLETGMVVRPKRFDWDHHWKVMEYIYEPFMTEGFTFTHEYVARSYDLMIFGNPNAKHMTFPGTWLWVNRLTWGLNSVLAHLRATGPWPAIWRAAIEGELEGPQPGPPAPAPS